MKRIKIDNVVSSDLSADFSNVAFIDIEDQPFAQGGFGEVYKCLSINGKHIEVRKVVKIFTGKWEESNLKTTRRLQNKIKKKTSSIENKNLLESYPAFKGFPHFSFEGECDGKRVAGFVSDDLFSLGFVDFEQILRDEKLLSKYHELTIQNKILITYQLVSAFKVLEDFCFIHADLKPEALFINFDLPEVALIDYDSGVIVEDTSDEPLTWGAPNDWVAPEIWSQQSVEGKIRVDSYSDRWSLAIAIHYLLTTYHPLFFLAELSPRVTDKYLNSFEWPNIDKNEPYFQKANEKIYDVYVHRILPGIPNCIKENISKTIKFGYKEPVARTSCSEWEKCLKSTFSPPEIKTFKSDRSVIIQGVNAEITWEVHNAYKVIINNNIGEVQNKGSVKVEPKIDTVYKLTAVGYCNEVSKEIEIRVFPIPFLYSLEVPTPEFKIIVDIKPLNNSFPKIDLSINIKYLNFYRQNFVYDSVNLKVIKSTYLSRISRLKLYVLYEYFKEKVSKGFTKIF